MWVGMMRVQVAMIVAMMVLMIVMGMATCPDAFDVMVMAFLRQAHFALEAKHLGTILAELAVHRVVTRDDIANPVGESIKNQWVIVQVACFDKFYIRMSCGDLVSIVVNSLH